MPWNWAVRGTYRIGTYHNQSRAGLELKYLRFSVILVVFRTSVPHFNSNPEEQFGAPFAPLGPSGEMTILRPIFGRGVARRRLGAEVPKLHQKFPLLLGAPVVPKAQI